MADAQLAELTDEQHTWVSSFCGVDSRAAGTGIASAPASAPLAAGLEASTALSPVEPAVPPDPKEVAAIYKEVGIALPGGAGTLSAPGGIIDPCWSPKTALVGAWLAVIGAGAGTAALVLAPEPTTLTKWAALATAAALVGALVGLAAAYGAVADCEQSAADADARKREIEELRRKQKSIEDTVEQLKKQIEGR